jgi:hypothetical protein
MTFDPLQIDFTKQSNQDVEISMMTKIPRNGSIKICCYLRQMPSTYSKYDRIALGTLVGVLEELTAAGFLRQTSGVSHRPAASHCDDPMEPT